MAYLNMYNIKLIENIILKIYECKEEIHVIDADQLEKIKRSKDNYNYSFRYSIADRSYHFTQETFEKWKNLVQQISKSAFKNQFSLKYIDEGLRKYFHENYEEYNFENLNKFLLELKENVSCLLFYIPIYGIELSKQELSIGSFSLRSAKRVTEEITKVIPELNIGILLNANTSPNQVFIINEYQTDSEKALDITLTQTNRFIDILNWKFSQLLQPYSNAKYIISLQESRFEKISYISLINNQRFSFDFKNIFSILPLDLNKIEEFICSNEVLWLVEIISQEKINDYYDAILKSIHWFSQFWIEQQSDNKLLYLAISLEALLSEPISTSSFISDRVAFILGEDKKKRLELKYLSKKLYNLRSDIAHGNNINIVQEEDLRALEDITRKIIQYALDNRDMFNSLNEFKKSIDDRKYE